MRAQNYEVDLFTVTPRYADGAAIVSARHALLLSQKELADYAGVPRSAVQLWEVAGKLAENPLGEKRRNRNTRTALPLILAALDDLREDRSRLSRCKKDKGFVTAAEIARAIDVTVAELGNMVHQGIIPPPEIAGTGRLDRMWRIATICAHLDIPLIDATIQDAAE